MYSPQTNKLFVASAKGKLYIFDGTSFALITTIDFRDDADNLRYDPASKLVYLGYGDGDSAAIAVIDATTNQRQQEFKVGAHPESFQLETSGPNIFVNLPDAKQIAVVNRKSHAVSKWPLTLGGNFPMALDEADHRLFIATRTPARLAVFDTNSGHMVAALPCVQDADDLYFDAERRRIYIPGGKDTSASFNRRMPIITRRSPKFLRPWAHAPQDMREKLARRVSTACTLPFLPAQIPKQRYGFTRWRTDGTGEISQFGIGFRLPLFP